MNRAAVPERPVSPRWRLNVLLSLALGLLVGIAATVGLEHLDDSVKSLEDIERRLGMPVLGQIPSLLERKRVRGAREAGLPPLTGLDPRSSASEAFRVLRTHVLRALETTTSKSVLFTSALPREGKSTIAANLALAMAQTDRQVILVECNLRTPIIGRVFPETSSPGLSALLARTAEAEEIVRPTVVSSHLRCVVSGPSVPNPAELLETRRMAQFLAEVRGHADVILLDVPDVLSVADAEIIGGKADGVILIARVGQASRRAVMQARERMERAGVRVIGVVLNGVR